MVARTPGMVAYRSIILTRQSKYVSGYLGKIRGPRTCVGALREGSEVLKTVVTHSDFVGDQVALRRIIMAWR